MVNDTDQTISPRVSAIIDRHSRGDLEHVGDALSLLWNAANQRGAVVTPSTANQAPVSPLVSVVKNPDIRIVAGPARSKPYKLESSEDCDGKINQTRSFL